MLQHKRMLVAGMALLASLAAGLPLASQALKKPREHTPTLARGPALSRMVRAKIRPRASLEALRAARDDDPEDRAGGIPHVGPVREAVTNDGTIVAYQEITPGYVQTGLDAVDLGQFEADEPDPVPSVPAGRTPVDPKSFGFDSMEALEADVRKKFRIPSQLKVELWIEERHGKKGLAIDTIPSGASGAELPLSEAPH